MKKIVETTVLIILVLVLCASTVLFAMNTVSLKRSISEINDKMNSDELTLQATISDIDEELSAIEAKNEELKSKLSSLKEENASVSADLLQAGSVISYDEIVDLMGGDRGKRLDIDGIVYEWKNSYGYVFVTFEEYRGNLKVKDING